MTAPPRGAHTPQGAASFPHPYYGSEGTAEAFAFHAGGANFAFGDGSVHHLDEEIDIRVFARLVTRANQEIVAVPR
jgi:prepilin-type processing-associated H-X9-DG protein